MELAYSIDSWDRLTECRSNKSSEYYITVSDAICGDYFNAKIIRVMHPRIGCVFATSIDAQGYIVNTEVPDVDREYVLAELKRFGFNIKFTSKLDIPKTQLHKLRGLYDIGYDRIRLIAVPYAHDKSLNNSYVVAFKSDLGDWCNNWYSPKSSEFNKSIVSGKAYIVKDAQIVNGEDWSWVHGVVYRIADILSMYSSELYSIERRNLAELPDSSSSSGHYPGQFIMSRFCERK